MNLLRRFPALVFALSLLSIAGFCVATESFGWLVVAGTMAALSWYYTEGPRGRTLPRWVANLLLVAAILYAVADWLQRSSAGEVMDVVGRFTLILTVIKLYEAKAVRDYGQLLALGAVLMVAGALQSVQLSFAILLLVYVLLGLYVVLLFQLHMAYERSRAVRRTTAPPEATFIPAVQAAFGRRLQSGFSLLGATMAIGTLALSGIVFVLFPRGVMGSDLGFRAARAISGFSGEVSLRDNPRISESRREVLTVMMLDPQGTAIEWTEPLRLRGAVLDHYVAEEARWTTSRRIRESSRTIEGIGLAHFVPLGLRGIDTRVQTYSQVVRRRSIASDVLFSSSAPVGVATDMDRFIQFEPGTLLLREQRGASLGASAEYRVQIQPFPTPETMESLTGEAGWPTRIRGTSHERFQPLAAAILRERSIATEPPSGEAAEVARWRIAVSRAFVEELQSSQFEYTTDLSEFIVERGEDPSWTFLTTHRFGHCEHFAAAMVMLCRSIGVDARLITGYIAFEFDESARQYIVRESNAHAWVEVRTGASTWATFDPTPSATLEALNESRRTWVDRWRWMYDRIEFMWNNRVVGFDGATQATLAERLSSRWARSLRDAVESLRDRLGALNAAFRLGPAGYIWLGLVGMVALLAVMTGISVSKRRRRVRRVAGIRGSMAGHPRRLLRDVAFYADALELLERAGLAKPAWQPPMAFARDVGSRHPELAEVLNDLVETFYRVRFGGRALDEPATRGLLTRLRDFLRHRPGRRPRELGVPGGE
jgi:transglutaminase-like putative cysteine protease